MVRDAGIKGITDQADLLIVRVVYKTPDKELEHLVPYAEVVSARGLDQTTTMYLQREKGMFHHGTVASCDNGCLSPGDHQSLGPHVVDAFSLPDEAAESRSAQALTPRRVTQYPKSR